MKIRDIMHAPAQTCPAQATVAEVARRMAVAEVGAIVVVDEGRIVGLVTDRDLVLRGYAHGLPSDAPVEGLMSHGVISCDVDDDVFDAASAMAARGVRRLPVLDRQQLAGMVTLDDLSIVLGHELADLGRAVAAQADTRHYAGWAGWG